MDLEIAIVAAKDGNAAGLVDAMMNGHAQKARIHSRDTLADALETSCRRLKDHIAASEKDVDQEIKVRVAVVSSVVVR